MVSFLRTVLFVAGCWLLCNATAAAQGSWIQTNGPTAALSTQLLKHPSGVMVAATRSGGIFRSTDHAESWRPASAGVGAVWATNLVRDPVSNRIYLCTYDKGMFYSDDTAQTWIAMGPALTRIEDCAFPGSGVIVAVGSEGVWRTTNNGSTWTQSNTGLASVYLWCIAAKPNGHLFVGSRSAGVFRSTDLGATWTPANGNITTTEIYTLLFCATNAHLYAGGPYTGVLESDDNGATWHTTALTHHTIQRLAMGVSSTTINASTYLNGIYQTEDLGASWSQIGSGIPNNNVRAVILNQEADLVAATWGNGIWKSTNNGVTWREKDSGLVASWVRCIASEPGGGVMAGVLWGGLFRTDNRGAIWRQRGLEGIDVLSFVARGTDSAWFAATDRGLSRSVDHGQSWVHRSPGFYPRGCTDVALTQGGTLLVTTSDSGVYRTVDDGLTWSHPVSGLTRRDLSCLLVLVNGSTVLAGSSGGGGVFLSSNSGQTWQAVAGVPFQKVHRWMQRASDGAIFAATEAGVFRSMSGGSSWTRTWPGTNAAYSLTMNQQNGHIFAASLDSVFASTNGGSTWTNVTFDLPPLTINTLHVGADQYLYLGSIAMGVFRSGVMVPVHFTAISAARDGDDVNVSWRTADEKCAAYFDVERRPAQGMAAWTSIALQPARGSASEYEIHDPGAPDGILDYRVRAVDADGTFIYSPLARVSARPMEDGIGIYPNPVQRHGRVSIRSYGPGRTVVVVDQLGREVLRLGPASSGTLDASALPGPGLYFIRSDRADNCTARAFVVLP